MAPYVSVIVPNYNHSTFLEDRIQSILNQSFQDFELILLDDCSTDQSLEILCKYSSHPKVSHFIVNEENSGSNYKQWNLGVSLAKGQLIWIAESDDTSELNFLENLAPVFADKNIVLAYSQSNRMDSEGLIDGDWFFQTDMLNKPLFDTNFKMKGIDFIQNYLIKKNVIPNASAVLFRKSSFELVQGAREDVKYCADWLFWLDILVRDGEVYYTPEKLNNFRFLENSVIGSSSKTSNVPFVKRYDILMRKELDFIFNRFNLKSLIALNRKILVTEILEEIQFLSKLKRSKSIISIVDFKLLILNFTFRQKISFIKKLLYSI